ncbi:MAG: hypothetical protein LBK58_12610 [Prevotellaceae bacterium]|jgi:transposase InsO family protein|nr:hypothetical protein [Prevotellaceae bacterium]
MKKKELSAEEKDSRIMELERALSTEKMMEIVERELKIDIRKNLVLSLITDACFHKIVGWNLSRTLRSSDALVVLKMALGSLRGKHPELIHHSDHGSQYCCRDYVNLLTCKSIQIIMTESGNPRENAIAERINGILKTEWIYRIIDLYNHQRPHQSIGYDPRSGTSNRVKNGAEVENILSERKRTRRRRNKTKRE